MNMNTNGELTFKVGGVTEEEQEKVMALLGIGSYKKEIWSWQFGENSPYCVTAYRNGVLVGFNGIIPIEVQAKEVSHKAFWSCDFVVDAQLRGSGVGSKLKDEVLRLYSKSIVSSYGISDVAYAVLKKKGWSANEATVDFKKLSKASSHRDVPKVAVQWLNSLRKYFSTNQKKTSDEYYWSFTNSLPPKIEIDNLWQHVARGYECSVVRNYDYSKWRYIDIPIENNPYLYLVLKNEKDALSALLIYSFYESKIKIVDYIGPKHSLKIKGYLLQTLVRRYKTEKIISFATSDVEWQNTLRTQGFFATSSKQRFVSKNLSPKSIEQWFLTSGDSDGDFLMVASDKPKENTEYHWRLLTNKEFQSSQSEWQELLSRSSCDKLFLSWHWQYSWWNSWGESIGAKLNVVFIYKGDLLVSILPLYFCTRKLGPFNVRRLQFLGNCWNQRDTVRTEYLAPIVDQNHIGKLSVCYAKVMNTLNKWDEFVWCDRLDGDASAMEFHSVLKKDSNIIEQSQDYGYAIDTRIPFSNYLKALSASTRAKVYNKRGAFEAEGGVVSETLDSQLFFTSLNEFHEKRWGKAVFDHVALQFHNSILSSMSSDKNYKVEYNVMYSEDEVISVLYDIVAASKVYNIQAGYEEVWRKKVSLGTLHLGYSIENAIHRGFDSYDMLLGRGKNSNYKSKIGLSTVSVGTTASFLKSKKVRLWYRCVELAQYMKKILY